MANLALLKAEFQTDPAALGYGTWATLADDQRIQSLFVDPSKRSIATILVASWQVVTCFDATEFAGLTQLQQAQLTTILSAGQVNLMAIGVRTIVAAIFPSGGPTRAALTALFAAQQRTQSRSTEIGIGATIEDVTRARLS